MKSGFSTFLCVLGIAISTSSTIASTGSVAKSGILDIASRPLRTLNLGSELFVFIEGDLQPNSTYQDGSRVLVGMPPFDEKRPYCHVEAFSVVPAHAHRSEPLQLKQIEGSLYDQGPHDASARFITKLRFLASLANLEISCFSPSSGIFKETSLGEFEQVFGIHLRFGNLSLGDAGVEIRNPLYGDYDVLTPYLLRNHILVSSLETIDLVRRPGRPGLRTTVSGGKILEDADYSQAFCEVMHLPEEDDQTVSTISLPAGLTLSFGGDVTGSYLKSASMDHGFSLFADLTGYSLALQLYCYSSDPTKPLRYGGARRITKPILDWSYTN